MNRVLFVTITVLCCVYAAPRQKSSIVDLFINEGNEQPVNIIRGRKIDIKQHPYTAAVIVETEHEGSAVIINNKWLLSTAWVPLLVDPNSILIRAGSSSAIAGGQTSWVEKVILHPKYKYDWQYDVSLIKLKDPLKFDDTTQPIKIGRSPPKDKTTAVLSGFGLTNTPSEQDVYMHDGWLRETKLKVIAYKTCKKNYYNIYKSFTDMNYCTEVTNYGGPCFYDFGNPLVYKGKLVGLFSNTMFCGDPARPSIYTDVTKFQTWVQDTIRHNSEPGEFDEL